jgi:hypothetical protein
MQSRRKANTRNKPMTFQTSQSLLRSPLFGLIGLLAAMLPMLLVSGPAGAAEVAFSAIPSAISPGGANAL